MSAVSISTSFHLCHLWDDRIREDILGSVSITTIFTSHSTSIGEDCLVLFTMAACLSGNSEHHTSNRICQRHSPTFKRWLLFRCKQAEVNRAWRSNDWWQQRQEHCKPFSRGSHHRNLSVIYIVLNLFYQEKDSRSISLNSHYLILFKNPRDKLQI